MSSEALLYIACIMVLLAVLQIAYPQASCKRNSRYLRRSEIPSISSSKNLKQQRKPDWIAQDILRLKALMPKSAGVRQIAAAFNRIQDSKADAATKRVWRVSKTYVANLLRANHLEAQRIRESIRQRQPGISTICHTWGIDLTGKKDSSGQLHHILGIIDHGSRLALRLIVTSKHSNSLMQHVIAACCTHGQPKRIRTDNERCFTSDEFRHALKRFGIHQQTTDLHCPWQNGRIERLFGTLKQQLDTIQIQSAAHLQSLLDEFKHWYNTIRLHQHLGYRTPQEVWQQQTQPSEQTSAQPAKVKAIWWTGWNGQLSGVQWRC